MIYNYVLKMYLTAFVKHIVLYRVKSPFCKCNQ